jgi:uncharacterized repeat protein (TIGR03803 family)
MKNIIRITCTLLMLFATSGIVSAQTFDVLASFNGFDGLGSNATLIQGPDGNYYGTTIFGGTISKTSSGGGVIYKVTPAGKITVLHTFCLQAYCPDGGGPESQLVLATDGNFYGTTASGGAYSEGNIFKITPSGEFTSLYNFCAETNLGICTDGSSAIGGLIQAVDGNLYGVASSGGSENQGTLFRVTRAGELTVLYNFCSQNPPDCTDGASPWSTLIQASDGHLYGTTSEGGAYKGGTVFKVSLDGTLTTIYNFCASKNGDACVDGSAPEEALIQASNGNFYGATTAGGTVGCGNSAQLGCGTVFELTPAGVLTTLHNFCSLANCADGAYPSGVTQGTDGNFYGVTSGSGAHKWGTLFQITSAGVLNTLHNFCALKHCYDGSSPRVAPLQATNGAFYDTTFEGGTGEECDFTQCGTVFGFSMGLAPFVQATPVAGLIGQRILILGNNLTGATGVDFNGISAQFSVVSDTLIAANVPTGAATGPVQVVTPGGTLTSNVAFQVEK